MIKKELEKESAKKTRKILSKYCQHVLTIENGHNHYDAYFSNSGEYKGLSLVVQDSEGYY